MNVILGKNMSNADKELPKVAYRMNKRLMDRYVETIALYKKKRPIDWKSLPNPPGCSEIDLAKYSAEIAPQSQNQQQQLTKSTAKPEIIQKHGTYTIIKIVLNVN